MTKILIIAAGFCVFIYLVNELIKSKDQQVAQLQAQLAKAENEKTEQAAKYQAQLEKIQAELENLKERKRQTGPTIAGLEDLSAHLNNILLNRRVEDTILTACINTAHELRQGPYVYDPEKPSGEGKTFK